jgi:hypothetical protein
VSFRGSVRFDHVMLKVASGVAGVVAEHGGDVVVARVPECADGKVAQVRGAAGRVWLHRVGEHWTADPFGMNSWPPADLGSDD